MIIYEGYFNDKEINNDEIITDIEQSELNKQLNDYKFAFRISLVFLRDVWDDKHYIEDMIKTTFGPIRNKIVNFLNCCRFIDDYSEPVFRLPILNHETDVKDGSILSIDNIIFERKEPYCRWGQREVSFEFHFNHNIKTIPQCFNFLSSLYNTIKIFNLYSTKLKPSLVGCIPDENGNFVYKSSYSDETILRQVSPYSFSPYSSHWQTRGAKKQLMDDLVRTCQYLCPEFKETRIRKLQNLLLNP